jgi:uncharacterized protein (TIGR02118 family)
MMMFRVSVMYPNQEGTKFNLEYYRTTHMELAKKLLKPFGLIRTEMDRGISGGGGQPAPYICVGQLYFESRDGYDRAVAEVGSIMRGDIPNFTNTTPIRQISEILD